MQVGSSGVLIHTSVRPIDGPIDQWAGKDGGAGPFINGPSPPINLTATIIF